MFSLLLFNWQVRPVALIPSSISPEVPQILINREPLSHLTPDVELLGDCDGIINQICLKLGDGWEDPVHKPELFETQELEPAKPGEDIAQLLPSSKVVTESTETAADVPVDGHSVASDKCNDSLGHSEKSHDEPQPSIAQFSLWVQSLSEWIKARLEKLRVLWEDLSPHSLTAWITMAILEFSKWSSFKLNQTKRSTRET